MNAIELKKKLKQSGTSIPDTLYVRSHRALSWLTCAEENNANLDLQFITLWIAYNSCYAIDEKYDDSASTEKDRYNEFVTKLVSHDIENRFFNLLWDKFSGPVRLLIENEYVFKPFWDFQRSHNKNWKKLHYQSISASNRYLAKHEVTKLLEVVLDRLYTLRNQIMHGGATYKSKVNRSQVRDACNILKSLVPIIIDIMIDNGDEDWGKVYYPVVNSAVLI
ncbi:MAG: hypothetical protein ABI760_11515 [Ferruginibacter sp.]